MEAQTDSYTYPLSKNRLVIGIGLLCTLPIYFFDRSPAPVDEELVPILWVFGIVGFLMLFIRTGVSYNKQTNLLTRWKRYLVFEFKQTFEMNNYSYLLVNEVNHNKNDRSTYYCVEILGEDSFASLGSHFNYRYATKVGKRVAHMLSFEMREEFCNEAVTRENYQPKASIDSTATHTFALPKHGYPFAYYISLAISLSISAIVIILFSVAKGIDHYRHYYLLFALLLLFLNFLLSEAERFAKSIESSTIEINHRDILIIKRWRFFKKLITIPREELISIELLSYENRDNNIDYGGGLTLYHSAGKTNIGADANIDTLREIAARLS